ncbi:hypothetical protein PGT21_026560 [Puccinia graminis f. sp. tritici]|uniref:Uncharacterized protein n=1 Tax=Puccinia graminis f. sp. tritici TaxID=56615 RepID=A0A5B0PDW3_PUCGR|nr:hypothetical protein PGT21_026560 [Puccinia graminis f. sp. tritici]KAA1117026.1 hypothetical protein PGTUg99_034269 [Puccinia graminis f. sp. tritici]
MTDQTSPHSKLSPNQTGVERWAGQSPEALGCLIIIIIIIIIILSRKLHPSQKTHHPNQAIRPIVISQDATEAASPDTTSKNERKRRILSLSLTTDRLSVFVLAGSNQA